MRTEPDRLRGQSHSLLKSGFPQQRHHRRPKLWWASEQFHIQLPLPHGTLTSACFHAAMQSWFEWLCGCDQDLFYMLRMNSECPGTPLCSSASQLLLRFPGLREAGGNWGGYTERMGAGQGWGRGWRNSFPVETTSPASVVWDYQKRG